MINIKMEVKNLAWNENLRKRCNHPLLPKGIRDLIIDKSGCGKSSRGVGKGGIRGSIAPPKW